MFLAELVGDLPLVIGQAVMKFIQQAADHDKSSLTLQGELNVTLPDLNILIGLNQTLSKDEWEENYNSLGCQTDKVQDEDPKERMGAAGGTRGNKVVAQAVQNVLGSLTLPKKMVNVGIQTIKMESTEDSSKSKSKQNNENMQKTMEEGEVEASALMETSMETQSDYDDDYDDDSDLDEIPFLPSPEMPEDADTNEPILNITPRQTRSSSRLGSEGDPGSVDRPRRRIKHTPKLQDLMARKKEVQSKAKPQAGKKTTTPGKESSKETPKSTLKSKQVAKGTPKSAEPELEFACELCDKTFSRRSNLKDHMFTHNKEGGYECPTCRQHYLRISKLKIHHRRAHGEEINEVSLQFLTNALSGIKAVEEMEEREEDENGVPVFRCDICGRQFNRKSSLKDHMFVHTKVSKYKCPECDIYFPRLSKLQLHFGKAHEGTLDIDKLPQPTEEEKIAMGFVEATTEPVVKGDHECPICLNTFNRYSSLKEHLFVHDRQYGFACDHCGLLAVSEARLKRHVIRKHGAAAWVKVEDRPFKCQECPQSFTSEQGLADHTAGHEAPKEFRCGHCHEPFESIQQLLKHNQTLHLNQKEFKQREFICGMCGRQCANSSSLKYHLKSHRDALQCDQCSVMFENEEDLMKHYEKNHGLKRDSRMEHLNSYVLRCLTCGDDFKGYQDLLKHQQIHFNLGADFPVFEGCYVDTVGQSDEKVDPVSVTFVCKICDNFKGDREAAEIHLDANHTADLNLNCEYCQAKFWCESSLRTHLIFEHGAQRLYECRVCVKKFTKSIDLSNHRKTEHSDISLSQLRGRSQCKMCNKTFNSVARLEDHIWVVHDKKPKPLQCPHCPKRFMRNYYLMDHVQTHTGATKYMCEVCGKGFRRPYELQQHRHDDERYNCNTCGSTFATYNGYKTHMRKHNETPPHMCRYCGKAFFFGVHLANHERSHTGDRPFVCPVCDKTFRTKNMLNEHKKLHGEDKHSCNQCFRSFPLKRQLNSHIETHHTTRKVFSCELCQKVFMKKQSYNAHLKLHNLRDGVILKPQPRAAISKKEERVEEEVEEHEQVEESQELQTTISVKGLAELQQNNDAEILFLVVDENGTILQQNDSLVQAAEDHVFVPTP